jgi:uncharacterized protein (UPF0261 family)
MKTCIAVLATLDTKGHEARFISEQLIALGGAATLIDIGVMGAATEPADISRDEVARAGGTSISELPATASREVAAPVMARGATEILKTMIADQRVHGVIGMGGLQGTALCTQVMRALPYGVPKLMVSTVASGNTSAYVDIKDITMMFSVSDILGLNPFTRMILARAAGAAYGMAQVDPSLTVTSTDKPVIGMTNLGVLTQGAQHAITCFENAGYEVIVFHAVGSGGRAMEQMMKEGLIRGVFDYALGEIADEVYGGLRAGGPERLTVAGKLGLPQVLCPGGAEHLGLLVEPPNSVPERYREHTYVFHNPVVFVPRLRPDELCTVARDIAQRLQHTTGQAVFMLPLGGTGSYARADGPLYDPEGDRVFFAELKARLPKCIEIVERNTHAEDPAFVEEAVHRLITMIAS